MVSKPAPARRSFADVEREVYGFEHARSARAWPRPGSSRRRSARRSSPSTTPSRPASTAACATPCTSPTGWRPTWASGSSRSTTRPGRSSGPPTRSASRRTTWTRSRPRSKQGLGGFSLAARVVSAIAGERGLRLGQRRVGRREPRDRHAERRAGHVVEADPVAEARPRSGSPPCSPQMPSLRSGLRRAAPLDGRSRRARRRPPVERLERVRSEDALLEVRGQEACLDVVAARSRRSSA